MRAAPSREDPTVAALSECVGGPAGRHGLPHRWWGPTRVVVALGTLVWVAGLLTKKACADDAWLRSGPAYARMCWNDWGWSGLATADRRLDEPLPPLPAAVGRLASWLAQLVPATAAERVQTGAVATVVLVAVVLLAATVAATRTDPRRPWDGAVVALAPLVALTWATSWHVLALGGLAVGLWAWARGRPVLAGIAFGAAGATMLSALSVVVALLVVAAGQSGTDRRPAFSSAAVLRTVLAALLTWTVLAAPRLLTSDGPPFAWWVRGVDGGSVWLVLTQGTGRTFSAAEVTVVSSLLWVAWAAVVAWLVLRADGPRWGRGPADVRTIASAALLLLGGALVLAPWVPPAAGLVLLPLAALAVPRWGPLLVWQAAEALHLVLTGWYYSGALAPADGGYSYLVWLAIGLRVAALGWLLSRAVVGLRTAPAEEPYGSGDGDPVEGGRGVADPHLDLLPDLGDPRP
ncbi:MAG: hypothetical protein ACI379_15445 [Nocardioides sp.]|uniref:hypothetical protein n=1 Tax=Nocardioides sp. TaxID=35761 RepID=UPI003EFC4CA0